MAAELMELRSNALRILTLELANLQQKAPGSHPYRPLMCYRQPDTASR